MQAGRGAGGLAHTVSLPSFASRHRPNGLPARRDRGAIVRAAEHVGGHQSNGRTTDSQGFRGRAFAPSKPLSRRGRAALKSKPLRRREGATKYRIFLMPCDAFLRAFLSPELGLETTRGVIRSSSVFVPSFLYLWVPRVQGRAGVRPRAGMRGEGACRPCAATGCSAVDRSVNLECRTRGRSLTGTPANERACAESNGRRRTAAPTCSARTRTGSRSGGVRGCAAVRHNRA